MARIRSIKPEFWKDELLGALPRDVRLLYIGLWNYCDDDGRMRAHPSYVKAEIFPYDDDITSKSILGMLQELSAKDRILLYGHSGQSYLWVKRFRGHQRIDKPSKSQLPAPPEEPRAQHSGSHPEVLQEDSANSPGGLPVGVEWSGRERSGEEGSTVHAVSEKPACPVAAPAPEGEGASKPNVVPLGLKPPGVPRPTPVASEPLPEADKKPQRTEGPGPHQRLLDALVAVFEAERKAKYGVQDGRDGKAVKWLLGAGTETEVLRRWRVGLGGQGRGRIDCIHELQTRWNGLGGQAPPGNGKNLRKGYADADDVDWSGDGGFGALNGKRGAK